ncbi:MAG: hypothetical protein LBE38_07285 [Deltaproteobacteria bacterium]|jgi:predicted AlkP superfamily phosphohydrolase/phosphomutase|nr:hypothetical protein [Deltaproteobacteria bacterium]
MTLKDTPSEQGLKDYDDDFAPPTLEEDGTLTFVMFGHKYRVQTDSPATFSSLFDIVHAHIREIRSQMQEKDYQHLDTLVQASFRMAFKLYKTLGAEKTLKEDIETSEDKLQDLLDLLDKNLP